MGNSQRGCSARVCSTVYCRWGCCRLCLFSPLGSACWCGFRLRPGFGYAVVSRLVMLWATSTYLRIACTVVQKIGNLFLALFTKQPCFLIEMRTECSIGDPPPPAPSFPLLWPRLGGSFRRCTPMCLRSAAEDAVGVQDSARFDQQVVLHDTRRSFTLVTRNQQRTRLTFFAR